MFLYSSPSSIRDILTLFRCVLLTGKYFLPYNKGGNYFDFANLDDVMEVSILFQLSIIKEVIAIESGDNPAS